MLLMISMTNASAYGRLHGCHFFLLLHYTMTPKPLILLDAGHGINTAGKRSPFTHRQLQQLVEQYPHMFPSSDLQSLDISSLASADDASASCLLEWQLNRDIAQRTQQLLLALDFDARLLVPEVADVSLAERVHRAQALCADHEQRGGIWPNRLLVSIHSNASGCSRPRQLTPEVFTAPSGWECHVSGRSYGAAQLAGALYREAFHRLPVMFPVRSRRGVVPRDTPDDSLPDLSTLPWESDLYILRHAPCQAVLTENLFMDCPKDCLWLLTDEGRDTLAQIHAAAIERRLRCAPSPSDRG